MRWQYYHTVWTVMVFGWVANYMVRMGITPALIPIMQEFGLSHAWGGVLASAFFYSYTFMQLPAGHLGDRLGRKTILVIGTFAWALMALLTGFANSFLLLFLFRFLTGVGEGTYFGNDRPIISAYTPPDRMGFGQGVSFIGLGIGMCLGVLLAGLIAEQLNWRYIFIFYSLPAFAAAFLLQHFIREPPRARANPGQHQTIPYHTVFKNRDLWLVYVGGLCIMYSFWVVSIWAPAMFQEIGVKELGKSSIYASLLGIAAVPGLILTGMVSDRLVKRGKGRKMTIAVVCLILSLLFFLMGYAVESHSSFLTLTILIFLSGFFLWGVYAPIYALLPELVPPQILGTTFGLTNTIHFLGSIVAPWATGAIKDATGSFAWGAYAGGFAVLLGSLFFFLIRPPFKAKSEIPVTV